MRGTLYERFTHLYPYHHQVLTAGLTWDEAESLYGEASGDELTRHNTYPVILAVDEGLLTRIEQNVTDFMRYTGRGQGAVTARSLGEYAGNIIGEYEVRTLDTTTSEVAEKIFQQLERHPRVSTYKRRTDKITELFSPGFTPVDVPYCVPEVLVSASATWGADTLLVLVDFPVEQPADVLAHVPCVPAEAPLDTPAFYALTRYWQEYTYATLAYIDRYGIILYRQFPPESHEAMQLAAEHDLVSVGECRQANGTLDELAQSLHTQNYGRVYWGGGLQ